MKITYNSRNDINWSASWSHRIKTVVSIGSLIAASIPNAAVADVGKNMNAELTKIKFVYVADSMMFRTHLDIRALLEVGCTYVTEESVKIQRLKAILSRHEFHQIANPDEMLENRYALF